MVYVLFYLFFVVLGVDRHGHILFDSQVKQFSFHTKGEKKRQIKLSETSFFSMAKATAPGEERGVRTRTVDRESGEELFGVAVGGNQEHPL